MLFRNISSVVAVYAIFLGVARYVLPWPKLCSFAFLALPGVLWFLCDAADAAGPVPERKRAAAVAAGFAAALAATAWFAVAAALKGGARA
ncbi:hypothetical protein [Desulfovirgula thermocuniculi]|uniref:hypothetical protein n=1 Tax=Desulfovirgula thermocuniculi TaxID=348842 RepID=UPI000429B19E|nr:hypothetical protein [Desulfovirgula thermocuniculi]